MPAMLRPRATARNHTCVDVPEWHSYLRHTCRDYHTFGWCYGGLLRNISAGGTVLGAPERSCCTCSRRGVHAPNSADEVLRQAVFLATHELGDIDVRLARHYVSDLASNHVAARLFILLFRTESSAPLGATELSKWRMREKESGAEIFLWNEIGLRRLFPALGEALTSSAGLAKTPRKVAKYFFFHASLLLWHATIGSRYPNLEYFWRIEPDAMFAGRLGDMVQLAWPVRADVLLPHIQSEAQNPGWPHWRRNEWGTGAMLKGIPAAQRLMSLVPIGRYSLRFLNITMAGAWWARGRIGYEEISLPTACASASSQEQCTLENFYTTAKIHSAKRVIYRPVWECEAFLTARQQETHELWHPVKNRSCLVDWLDGVRPGRQ